LGGGTVLRVMSGWMQSVVYTSTPVVRSSLLDLRVIHSLGYFYRSLVSF